MGERPDKTIHLTALRAAEDRRADHVPERDTLKCEREANSGQGRAMAEFRFGVVAGDYERSLAFYRDGLGLEIIRSWDEGSSGSGTLFRAADGTIEVLSDKSLRSADPRGVWVYIEVEDVDASFERAVAKGLPILMKPVNTPWGHRRFKVRDPDGIEVGLFSPLGVDRES